MASHRGAGFLVSSALLLLLLRPRTSDCLLKPGDLFMICRRSDPQLNECISQTLDKLRPVLKSGIKQLKIPSSEPLVVPRVQVLQGSGPVSIDSTFYDLHVQGITNYEVKQVRADLKSNRIDIEVAIPFLYMYGDYEMNGRILVLPISGKGDSWSNYTGVTGVMHLEFKPQNEHLLLDKLEFDISVNHAKIQLNNLFNGNKELGDAMNKFMSSNWKAVFQELKPVVDEAISALLTDIARKVFEKFKFDQLFPA